MSIEVRNLTYTYSPKSPYEKRAVTDVSFTINDGETVGIIGSTGSGKSTLIQHLNGLIRVTQGTVIVEGIDLSVKKPDFKKVRSMVGMLFQYPEYQLFEDTVIKDVMFGPKNFGKSAEEAECLAVDALKAVGLDVDEVRQKSPFDLSGGQRRRVAIAGVIACKPKILILDEPTAGLDPAGKRQMLELTRELKKGSADTIIMISHNMDEIAEFTDRVLVMNDGRLIKDASPAELFSSDEFLEGTGLSMPHTAKIRLDLQKVGFALPNFPRTPEELAKDIALEIGGGL